MSAIPSAAERILAQSRQMQGKDVVCDLCGSQHFYEVQISKYLSGGHGSVEIQQDSSAQTFPLLICVCGLPVLPKPSTNRRHMGQFETAHTAFRESVQKSIAFLKAATPKAITDEVIAAAAGKVVEGQVEELKARVNKLEEDLGAPTKANDKSK